MACSKQKIVVMELPPWYTNTAHIDAFSCEEEHGLFDRVVAMMLSKQAKIETNKKTRWYQTKTKNKLMKNAMIQDIATIYQKPSKDLLMALMDVTYMENDNDFECVLDDDKAGVKQLLLSYNNYTLFYIPRKEFTSRNGRKVIPVVTQFSQSYNLRFYDKERSLIGSYIVRLPGLINAYFIQQVLYVPGYKSLELLKRVTGNKYDFWDMALEAPCHIEAITPGFEQIQPSQLLKIHEQPGNRKDPADRKTPEHNKPTSNPRKPKKADGRQDLEPSLELQQINPLCCILDTASMNRPKREGGLDYFDESQIKYDLRHFMYTNSNTKTVYFRRIKRLYEGKLLNLVSVLHLRKEQLHNRYPCLYVSTTLRFCRALKLLCMRGNGELVSSYHSTLNELYTRRTFLKGTELYQDIHNPALASFNKRVCPAAWCNLTPKHVESNINDPIMAEVVDMGIRLMDSKIPNAFAVAELLYCPTKKAQKYIRFHNKYFSDKTYRNSVNKVKVSMIDKHMQMEWTSLMKIAKKYVRRRYPNDGSILSKTKELFANHASPTANKLQTIWQGLVKHQPTKIKDKKLIQLFSRAKVCFQNIRVYNKNKKLTRLSDSDSNKSGCSSTQQTQLEQTSEQTLEHTDEPGHPANPEADLGFVFTPDHVHISTWIKHMAVLLLSPAWLNANNEKREAVCCLLNLDVSLLAKQRLLIEWTLCNLCVVQLLKDRDLQDRLSKALIACLDATSTEHWRRKVELSFAGCSKRGVATVQPSNLKVTRKERKGSKVKKPKVAKVRVDMTVNKDSDELFLCEAAEIEEESAKEEDSCDLEIQGENLDETEAHDNDDLHADDLANSEDDSFIDDQPLDDMYSESEEEQTSFRRSKRHKTKRVKRPVSSESEPDVDQGRVKHKTKRVRCPRSSESEPDVDQGRVKHKTKRVRRPLSSESEPDVEQGRVLGARAVGHLREAELKRTFRSESEEEVFPPHKRNRSFRQYSSGSDNDHNKSASHQERHVTNRGDKSNKVWLFGSSEQPKGHTEPSSPPPDRRQKDSSGTLSPDRRSCSSKASRRSERSEDREQGSPSPDQRGEDHLKFEKDTADDRTSWSWQQAAAIQAGSQYDSNIKADPSNLDRSNQRHTAESQSESEPESPSCSVHM